MALQCKTGGASGVTAGDALCLIGYAGGIPLVARAIPGTGNTLDASRTVLGIAQTTVGINTLVMAWVAGDVAPQATTSLSNSGLSSVITVDASGRLAPLVLPTGGEFIVGTCDVNGHTSLQPRASLDTSALQTYNPKAYGCPWDGIHDDLPGWDLMMAAIPIPQTAGSVRIDLPWGLGYFSGDVHITRYVHIEGRGGGADPLARGSGFKLAPLAKVVFDNYISSGGGGSATSYLGHFAIQAKAPACGAAGQGTLVAGTDVWTSGYVELGTLVLYSAEVAVANPTQPGSGPDVAFRCIQAGTTGGAEPMQFSSYGIADIGTPIGDGGVTWTAESLPKDRQNGHPYQLGERITIPGDTRFIFECTTAGTSAGSPPDAFIQPWFQDLITTDNTVVWTVILTCNIFVQTTNVKIEHGQIRGGWGPAVYFESGGIPPTAVYADFPRVDHLDVYSTGGGVHLHGVDVGGGQISHVNFNGPDTAWRTDAGTAPALGTGEICIWDRGTSGNAMIANYAQFAAAPGFVSDSPQGSPGPGQASTNGSGSNWYNNLSECRPTWLGGGSWLGTDAVGFSWVAGTVFAARPACQNIVCTDPTTADNLVSSLTRNDGHSVFSFSTAVEQANQNFFAWSYNLPSANYNTIFDWGDMGWFALATGHANSHTRCVGVSGMAAVQGAAHWREYLGKYVGVDDPLNHAKPLPYRGVSTAALTANVINGGFRNVGDKYAVDSTGAAGTWDEYVVSVAGYRGPGWTMGALATQGIPEVGVPASMVEPSTNVIPPNVIPLPGSKVFRCAGGPVMGGQAGAAASILSPPVATPYTGYSVTIDGVSGMSSADIGRFLVISGAASPENNGAFAITDCLSLTRVVIYNPVLPTTPDGNNTTISWQELDVIATGTGAVEPNWAPAVAVGDLIADNSGVSGVTWMLIGFTPAYALGQFIDDPVIAYEPRAQRRWGDGAAAVVTANVVDQQRASVHTNSTAVTTALQYRPRTNIAECVDFTVVAKLRGATGSAAWKLSVGVERGSGASVLKYSPTPTLLWATDGLSSLIATAVACAQDVGDTSLIDLNVAGIAATDIDWGVTLEKREVGNY
jgi:hypothetical protein